MQRYILMRLSLAIPTILGAVTLVFFAMQLAPGDPAPLFIPRTWPRPTVRHSNSGSTTRTASSTPCPSSTAATSRI